MGDSWYVKIPIVSDDCPYQWTHNKTSEKKCPLNGEKESAFGPCSQELCPFASLIITLERSLNHA